MIKKSVKKGTTRLVKTFDRSDDSSEVSTDSDEKQTRKRKRSCSSLEDLDQMACTSVSSINLPPPAKKRKNASVKRKPMPVKCSETSSDSANYSVDSIHITPKRGRPKETSTKAPTKRKSVKKRLPSKRVGAPRQTKKKATPLKSSIGAKSEPTKEPSHQPTNPPSQACQPEANQPITKTTTAPPKASIITEPPKDMSDRQQLASFCFRAASERAQKFRFSPWNLSVQNDDMLSDEPVPVPSVFMDGAHLSEEIPMAEEHQLPKKPEVSKTEQPDEMHPELAEDEETT